MSLVTGWGSPKTALLPACPSGPAPATNPVVTFHRQMPSQRDVKARLDGAWWNLDQWKVSLPGRGMSFNTPSTPFQEPSPHLQWMTMGPASGGVDAFTLRMKARSPVAW